MRHYGTQNGAYTADELLMIPQIIEQGEVSRKGDKIAYKLEKDGVTYTVTTEKRKGNEEFTNFFTNRKPINESLLNTDEQHGTTSKSVSTDKVSANNSNEQDYGAIEFQIVSNDAYAKWKRENETDTQDEVLFRVDDEAEDVLYRENEIKDRIEYLFNEAISGRLRGKPISIGKLTNAGRIYLQQLSGIEIKENVDFVLNPSDLVHIYKDHFGSNEKDKGQNMSLDIEDVRSIVDVVTSPDKIVFFKENEGSNRNMFYFFKESENGTYNLMEIYADRKGNLTAKTFYKTRKDASQRIMDLEKSLFPTSETNFGAILSDDKGVSQRAMTLSQSLHTTSETDGATLNTDAKIPQMFETANVNEENSQKQGSKVAVPTRAEQKAMADHAQQMASKLNLPNVEVVTNRNGLEGKKR